MVISDRPEVFAGLPIVEFDPELGVQQPKETAYRLSISYDDFERRKTIEDVLEAYVNDPIAEGTAALVVGPWDYEASESSAGIVRFLVDNRERLPDLRALFLGDITYEEQEISWIEQSDVSPLFAAFPLLEDFRVRGGHGLEFTSLRHERLRTLVVETGGLGGETLRQILSGDLPELVHLELWLGSDGYGADYTMDDLEPLLSGALFPKLRYLGLRDSERSDEIAVRLASSPMLERIRVLDLSLGTLGDRGLEALLANPSLRNLDRLDLHHHYATDAMCERVERLGIDVDLSDPQGEDDDGDRYVAVSE